MEDADKESLVEERQMDASIIVPCYNEEKRLPTDVFSDFMKKHREIAFLFVNDGSSDKTGEVLRKLCLEHPNAEYFELAQNSGKAEAVRQGMLQALVSKAPFIGFWDADLATPLEELPRMLASAKDSTLYVSGCRLLRLGTRIRRNPFRHYIGRVFATAASLYLDLPVYDTQCGAKIYAADVVSAVFRKPFVSEWCFDVEILRRMTRLYGRERIIADGLEFPLSCWEDKSGSKIRLWRVMKDLFRLLSLKDE